MNIPHLLTRIARSASKQVRVCCHSGKYGQHVRHFSTKPHLGLGGVYPPIITPFDENEEIDYGRLKQNLEKWEKVPFRGYVVLGSTGEFVSLSSEERLKLVQLARETVLQDKLIIAGSGCESTKYTIEQTKRMAEAGADAVLVVSPSYYKGRMTESALYSHYEKVADESTIPVILYNVPANTGFDLSPSVICRLADHPNIIGLKESGGDITKIGYLVHKTKGKEFQIIAGSAGFLYSALCVGCVGGIAALANSLGGPTCDLHNLFVKGEHSEARELQHRLIGPNLCVTRRFGIPGVKKSMDLLGYYGGPCRSPLQSLAENESLQLTSEFKINGFL